MLHHLRRLLARVVGPLGKGRCIDCNSRLTTDELRYYHSQCEKCIAHDAAWLESLVRHEQERRAGVQVDRKTAGQSENCRSSVAYAQAKQYSYQRELP